MSVASPAPQTTPGVKTNTMALVSLIAGILGLTLFPFLGSIAAVITGNMGRKEIAASAGAETGDGMAMAGVIMGWIGIGLGVLGICIVCLTFVLIPLGVLGSINLENSLLLSLVWLA
ncbi:MAG TPA: DUF4190 domain-containing protein [Anaerolineales bacterium]|nr:DUF4190 domain-containing protein [Anaerolineales bacterium]